MGDIKVINRSFALSKLNEMVGANELIKAVVDIENKIMALDGDLHADGEAELLKKGSKQANLWGINLYPAKFATKDWIEFDSMINIRPSQGNRSRGVEDSKIQKAIVAVVNGLIG